MPIIADPDGFFEGLPEPSGKFKNRNLRLGKDRMNQLRLKVLEERQAEIASQIDQVKKALVTHNEHDDRDGDGSDDGEEESKAGAASRDKEGYSDYGADDNESEIADHHGVNDHHQLLNISHLTQEKQVEPGFALSLVERDKKTPKMMFGQPSSIALSVK